MKCFNNFVQSAVNARREEDENPNSSFVADRLKLLANSSYGYQFLDRSRHTVTKYLGDGKIRRAINSKISRRLDFKNDQLHKVKLVKSETEHKVPIIVELFMLQSAKLRMLELFHNFFDKYCYVTKLKNWRWIETWSMEPYLSTTCMIVSNQQRKKSGNLCKVKTVRMIFQLSQQQISTLVLAALSKRSSIDENLAYSKKIPLNRNFKFV